MDRAGMAWRLFKAIGDTSDAELPTPLSVSHSPLPHNCYWLMLSSTFARVSGQEGKRLAKDTRQLQRLL